MRLCIRRCGIPALPDHDLCLTCVHGEMAERGRRDKRRKRRKRTYSVSVSAEMFARIQKAAKARGVTVSALVEEVCRG